MNNIKSIITGLVVITMMASSCRHILPPKEVKSDINDTIVAASFTGVKKYFSEGRLIKEVTFKDGIKDGLCKNYYDDGRLKTTIIYRNNIKADTSKWYYPEGGVYRATPYKNGKVDGIQKKYYKNGRLQAELPYSNGFRKPGLKEYFEDGRELTSSVKIVAEINDSYYKSHSKIRVILKLSNDSKNVEFYKGTLSDGAFNPDKCKKVTISSGMGYFELTTDPVNGRGYVDVIAVYSSRFRNKAIITKRIKLPYNNLY